MADNSVAEFVAAFEAERGTDDVMFHYVDHNGVRYLLTLDGLRNLTKKADRG